MAQRERKTTPPASLADQVLDRHDNQEEEPPLLPPPKLFLPTGCTLMNLAFSDRSNGGWPTGRISNPIGDTDTGKTVTLLSSLAEGCRLPAFNDYDFIYAGCETDLSFHPAQMFGKRFADRVKILSHKNEKKEDRPPETVEELHYHMVDRFREGKPFVYILDSLDSLPSEQELKETGKRFLLWKKAKEEEENDPKKKKSKGSYNMSKQKYMSQMLREIGAEIEKTDNIFIPISQVRMNIEAMYDKWTRSGGKGLDFYARIICWLFSFFKQGWVCKDKVKDEIIGRMNECDVSKNHVTGKKRKIPFWVYDGYGISDIRSNIDWLILKGHWARVNGKINAVELDALMYTKDLILHIQQNNLERKLIRVVQMTWNEIEASLELNWKPRYE